MAIITISRQYGSGGNEIAAWVSEKLGYPLFDKSLIDKAAAQAGLSQKEIRDFSEDNYKITSFLDRLFNRMAVSAYVRTWEYPELLETPVEEPLDETTMLTLVQKAVRSACESGNMIIVGRGSQAILKDESNVIHVRIVAPLEDRIQRVKEEIKLTRELLPGRCRNPARSSRFDRGARLDLGGLYQAILFDGLGRPLAVYRRSEYRAVEHRTGRNDDRRAGEAA